MSWDKPNSFRTLKDAEKHLPRQPVDYPINDEAQREKDDVFIWAVIIALVMFLIGLLAGMAWR